MPTALFPINGGGNAFAIANLNTHRTVFVRGEAPPVPVVLDHAGEDDRPASGNENYQKQSIPRHYASQLHSD
ncbi:hypothetical protein ACFVUS_37220 [Nocardia sp. NPDC058058]|uniref:hypothetical protein n=1 Tax=Nocardia sp. NPDC058058 TaxID=3346317 RepID=UPI0036DD209D